MGDIAGMMFDEMIINQLHEPYKACQIPFGYNKRTIWKSAHGTIKIANMTDKHLSHTISYLERRIDGSANDDNLYDYIISMKMELERRNKMSEKIKGVSLKVVGVTFKNDDGINRKDIIGAMMNMDSKDIHITIEREPNNKFDPNAIKVIANGSQIGYIGKDYAQMLTQMMDMEFRQFGATIKDCGMYNGRPYCEIIINEM